jgi:hypothetical protein
MPSPKKLSSKTAPRVHARAMPAMAKPAPPPPKRFLVRCTFVGEDKKQKLEGSFRFACEGADATAVLAKLEPAVKKLRRTGELPPRCAVYVEFILELAELSRGIIADLERWESSPRRFQHGCITLSDTCAVYHHGHADPAFRFGKAAEEQVNN